jgi:uncharacterized protein YbjT (DUF2867 family)
MTAAEAEAKKETPLPGRRAVIIGASGYIGTHLVPRLVEQGWAVRATARSAKVLAARQWHGVEILQADILDAASLDAALADMDVAFYLVHCMSAGGNFAAIERQGAGNFVAAANAAGLRRIVYLGGLTPRNPQSQHLQGRIETGEILRHANCEVVEIRAGMVIGPGSAAWEVMRDLVNHLPIMITPRWVRSRSTPIGLDNLMTYLIGLATAPLQGKPVFEASGGDIRTYEDMMLTYGKLIGKRPIILDVPVLTPKLSSYWLRLITSVPTNVAAALVEGLTHDLIADDAAIRELIPQRLLDFKESVEAAMKIEEAHAVATRWVEGSLACRDWNPQYAFYAKCVGDEAIAQASVDALWKEILLIGNQGDFFYANLLWRLRRLIDYFLGGPAMRFKRRHPTELRVGDVFDGWRVIGLTPGARLTLLMEMRTPGSGVLEFEIEPADTGNLIRATAYLHPAGVWGLLYWYAMWPFHVFLFAGLTRAIERRAEKRQGVGDSG